MNNKFTLVRESLAFTDNAVIVFGTNKEKQESLEKDMWRSLRKLLQEHPDCLEDDKILEYVKREANIKFCKCNFPYYYHYTSSISMSNNGREIGVIHAVKIGNFTLLDKLLNHESINCMPIIMDVFLKIDGKLTERIRRFCLYSKLLETIDLKQASITRFKETIPVTEVYQIDKPYVLEKK